MAIEEYRENMFRALEYVPTGKEQWAIHNSDARIKLIAGGERGGKSFTGAKEAVLAAPLSELIWIVGPEFDIARTEFEYCLNDFNKQGMVGGVSFPKQGPCSFTLKGTKELKGCEIVTKSAKEPQKLGMEAPDFILACEAAQMEYEAYLRLRGRIAEKRGKMVLSGTFEGSLGWYPDLFIRWQGANDEEAKSFSLPTWSNTLIYPGGRNDPEILSLENSTPHDRFMERYAGVPCKPSGLIMSEFNNAVHVGEYEFDPNLPVDVAVDPGYAGAHAVLVIQVKNDIPHLIDEVYLQGYVTEEIIDICKQRMWWGKVVGGAIDVAGRQHQAMAAPVEIWQNKAGVNLQSKQVEIEAGIDLLRSFLLVNPISNTPKLFVDYKCKGFIAECGGGKSPVYGGGPWLRDINTGKPKAQNDHACKAVIYWLASKFGYTARSLTTEYKPIQSLHFGNKTGKWWRK